MKTVFVSNNMNTVFNVCKMNETDFKDGWTDVNKVDKK
ncbi:hypothetical protein LMxysn_0492 [Listeria monocytogenes]|nr:hypothetical protein LMxysn_0492 [Listeria monocytogenes]